MSDGSKFTSIAQSINEAKWLIDYKIELKLNKTLIQRGFSNSDFFKYNNLKIYERIKIKQKLVDDLIEGEYLESKEKFKTSLRILIKILINIKKS